MNYSKKRTQPKPTEKPLTTRVLNKKSLVNGGVSFNTSGDINHEKFSVDIPTHLIAKYGRAPDQNKYKDVMDYVYRDNLIPDDVCDKVVEKLEQKGVRQYWEKHDWYNMIKDSPQNIYAAPSDQNDGEGPSEEVMMMYPQESETKEYLDSLLMPYVQNAMDNYEKKFSSIELDNSGDPTPLGHTFYPLRYQKYDVNDGMKIHYDLNHSLFHSCDYDDKAIPTLTICLYLTQQGVDFEGGDVFIRSNKMTTNKGDIVIFPCTFIYPHEVSPVTKILSHKKRVMAALWFW